MRRPIGIAVLTLFAAMSWASTGEPSLFETKECRFFLLNAAKSAEEIAAKEKPLSGRPRREKEEWTNRFLRRSWLLLLNKEDLRSSRFFYGLARYYRDSFEAALDASPEMIDGIALNDADQADLARETAEKHLDSRVLEEAAEMAEFVPKGFQPKENPLVTEANRQRLAYLDLFTERPVSFWTRSRVDLLTAVLSFQAQLTYWIARFAYHLNVLSPLEDPIRWGKSPHVLTAYEHALNDLKSAMKNHEGFSLLPEIEEIQMTEDAAKLAASARSLILYHADAPPLFHLRARALAFFCDALAANQVKAPLIAKKYLAELHRLLDKKDDLMANF